MLEGAPKRAQQTIDAYAKSAGKPINGWMFLTETGLYGTNYLNRAFITAIGLGANRPEDAIYPTSLADANGQPYSGSNKYVIHFAKGQTPPANGFWSLTLYNAQMFFVPNDLDRYTVSPRNALKYNPDGSLDLYVHAAERQSDQLASGARRPVQPELRLY